MGLTEILTIIGGIGGIQGIIESVKWWRNRKLLDRQKLTDVVSAENENYRKHIDWLENRLKERDAKIDHIYSELRSEQVAHQNEVHLRHEVELKLAEAEARKCYRRGCADREPPSDY